MKIKVMKAILKLYILIALLLLPGIVKSQQVEVVMGDEIREGYQGKSYLVVNSLRLRNFSVSASVNGPWFAKIHPNVLPPAPIPGENYVRVETILEDGITSESAVMGLSAEKKITSFSYTDGLGRTLQDITVAASPASNDVVQFSYCDSQGRPARQYLPYTAEGASGAYRPGVFSEQSSFYNNSNDKIKGDSKPYSEVAFDNSPLNRVTQTTAVGAGWTTAPITKTIRINGANDAIPFWEVTNGLPSSSSSHPAGALSIDEMVDEQGAISRSYTDFLGRTMMKEAQAPQGGWARILCLQPAGRITVHYPTSCFFQSDA